jgi:hypothetical protein
VFETTTVPVISVPWMVQWYVNDPRLEKSTRFDSVGASTPVSKRPGVSEVAEWLTVWLLVQHTHVLGITVTELGE